MQRGEIWWASLSNPSGSGPGYRRPVLVIQSDSFNKSRIQTVIVVAITSNIRLADVPGNVLLKRRRSGLPKDSVANVSQVLTIDRSILTECIGSLSQEIMLEIENGLRLVLSI